MTAHAASIAEKLHPTQKHYDKEVDLFKSFLDPYMKYSSGLWDDDSNCLESAAVKMLDKIIDFIPDIANASIMEIGPGWGSFVKRCKERNGGALPRDYVAFNPSVTQNSFLRDSIDKDLKIEESAFEEADLTPFKGRFDFIVGLGSFCHIAELEKIMPLFQECLSSQGKIIIEDTMYLSEEKLQRFNEHPQTRFIQREVFGKAPIPSLPNFLEICDSSQLALEYVLEHSDSYFKTLSEWVTRLSRFAESSDVNLRPSIIENIRYMELTQRGWGYTIGNYLIVLKKVRQGPRFLRARKL